MSKFKKIDKEFKLTDSTVNVYGFRLMTAGYLIDEYKKNPIGYLMHERGQGVAVRWEDFRIDGDEVFAKPVINLSHPKGQCLADDVENGFINGASVGHFVILETNDDPALRLPNQSGPTVTKWYNRECSLVDIPGNTNSLSLYDKDGNPLNLADINLQKNQMEKIILSPALIAALNLGAAPTQDLFDTAVTNLVAENAALTGKVNTAAALQKTAEDALKALKAEGVTEKVTAILADALVAKKITAQVQTKLAADYATNPTGLKELVDSLPAYAGVTEKIAAAEGSVQPLAAKTWNELDMAGELEALKAADLNLFKEKYRAEFKTEYAGK